MTDITSGLKMDIGHGVSVQLSYIDGELHGAAYWHEPCGRSWISVRPAWKDGWDVLQLDPLTLSPSLLCRHCGHHGFIREGRWVPA